MGKGKRLKKLRQIAEDAREAIRQRARTAAASVMVRCPATDKFFPTGVASTPASFNASTFENNVTAPCPHCGGAHRWGDSEIALGN